MKSIFTFAGKVLNFYFDGFRNMSLWGKKVWIIIIIKLFVIFVILKLFFFPDILKKNYSTDEQRSEHVIEQLTNITQADD
jgi:hypothetical protein